jgi:hypothetical protein
VRQAERTFVGFAADQTLTDFEATAQQATRVLRVIKTQLCRLGPQHERARDLRAAVSTTGGEIRSVHFSSAQLLLADVGVHTGVAEPTDALPGATTGDWVVRVQRLGDAWQVISAAPKSP